MKTAMTVAGSDPVSGAGLQADIKAMNSLGVHCASVVTAVTAQNTKRVSGIFPMGAEAVKAQLDAVLNDLDIRAAKTGMLYSEETVRIVADAVEDRDFPIIVDPVMVATVGGNLSTDGYVEALKKHLMPISALVTPNKQEAERIVGFKIRNEDDAAYACEIIGRDGSCVLLKSGTSDHRQVTDYLYLSSGITKIQNPRINGDSGHGSGCVLSSFITANIANGLDLVTSVYEARKMIQKSIAGQYRIGNGVPVVNPNVTLLKKDDADKVGILRDLDTSVQKLCRFMPFDLVPASGANIAYAVRNAKGPEEIAGIDGHIVMKGSDLKGGKARFGAGDHLSYVLTEVMGTSPGTRSVAFFQGDDALVKDMRHAGFKVIVSDLKITDDTAAETIRSALGKDQIPDAVVFRGKTCRVYVFGKGPREVVGKIDKSV